MKKDYEHQEQSALFEWAKSKPELKNMFAIPNGSHKSIPMAMKFKREGLKSGVPDVFLPIAKGIYHGLFIEMKTPQNKVLGIKKGTVNPKQKEWIKELNNADYKTVVCYGWIEAKEVIEGYLKGQ